MLSFYELLTTILSIVGRNLTVMRTAFRLPLACEDKTLNTIDVVDVFRSDTINIMSIDVYHMRKLVDKDCKIRSIINSLLVGKKLSPKDTWNVDPREFTVENNFLLKSDRIVVPSQLQQKILNELHVGHFGVIKMKSLARSHCWWHSIDKDITNLVNTCESCLLNRKNPPKTIVHPWEPATRPFERVHVDFAGPFMGVTLFILVDAYSKWPGIKIVKNMLATSTIDICCDIFM